MAELRRPGRVYTFYSYKGGVGRTMALANVAALLSRQDLRVLAIDFDLEAPGLDNYFTAYDLTGTRKTAPGLVDLFGNAAPGKPLEWRPCVVQAAPFPSAPPVDLILAGKDDGGYAQRLRALDWQKLFDERGLGASLEAMREEWIAQYDAVLVDSRTGLTDTGGICTIHLPDAIIALFTANVQSLEGIASTMREARRLREELPLDREKLVVVPVPARDESTKHVRQATDWQRRYGKTLGGFYLDWLHKGIEPADAARILRIPYVSDYSFGEPLPVVEEGTTAPGSLGFAYGLLGRFIASRLDWREVERGELGAATAELRTEKAVAELEAERRKQEEERRTAARRRRNSTVAGFLILAAAASGTWSVVHGLIASRAAAEAARQQALLAAAGKAEDPLQGALVVGEIHELHDDPAAMPILSRLAAQRLPQAVLRGHTDAITSAAVSQDGKSIVTGSADSTARVWSATGRGDPVVLTGHAAAVRGVRFRPGAQPSCVTTSADGSARLWTWPQRNPLYRELRGAPRGLGTKADPAVSVGSIVAPAFSANGRYIVAARTGDNAALLWDTVPSGDVIHQISVDPVVYSDGSRLTSLLLAPDHLVALTPDLSRLVHAFQGMVFAVANPLGASRSTVEKYDFQEGLRSAVSPDGLHYAVLGKSGVQYGETANLSFKAAGLVGWTAGREGTLVTAGNQLIAVALSTSEDGTVDLHLWPWSGGFSRRTWRVPRGVASLQLSPDESNLAAGFENGTALVWGTANPGVTKPTLLAGHTGRVTTLAFSPDGKLLVTAGEDRTARVWPLAAEPALANASGPQVAKALAAASTACLLPDQRVARLTEPPEVARKNYDECEKRYERTPLSDEVLRKTARSLSGGAGGGW